MTKDQIANKLYKTAYTNLSSWGRTSVDRVFNEIHGVSGSQSIVTDGAISRESNVLRAENAQLWDDLEDARVELEELKREYEDHLSRCAGER